MTGNTRQRITRIGAASLLLGATLATACARTAERGKAEAPVRVAGAGVYTVRDTIVTEAFEASGIANPIQQATLSTKLMGTVNEVLVREGDAVSAGQVLVRLDARDVVAKAAQITAGISEAEAVQRDAATQAARIRSLYADSAATRAQLDAVETAVARAEAAVRSARASARELDAVGSYAVIRAPFAGIVTKRFVDPGAFAAPGAPLVAVQDGSRVRIAATATPELARGIRRGKTIPARIEGMAMTATVEGVVPAAGNLYTINAIVANRAASILPGSAATLEIAGRDRRALVVPLLAIVREGDLTGVVVRGKTGDERRWIRIGARTGDVVEVTSGLRAGEAVLVPGAPAAAGMGG
jgi:RND family efflux transporter MFP subunit